MLNQVATIDPVVALKARIEAIHDAVQAARSPQHARRLEAGLAPLWAELGRTKPTTDEGLALVVEEAESYEGELVRGPFVINIRRYFGAVTRSVREGGAVSDQHMEWLDHLRQAGRLACGADHPLPNLAANALGYLRTRH